MKTRTTKKVNCRGDGEGKRRNKMSLKIGGKRTKSKIQKKLNKKEMKEENKL